LKNNSLRKVENSLFNISSQTVEQNKAFQKVRSSVAIFGLALSIGSVGILLNQQDNQPVDATTLPNPDRSTQVLGQVTPINLSSDKLSSAASSSFKIDISTKIEPKSLDWKKSVILNPLNFSFVPSSNSNEKSDIERSSVAKVGAEKNDNVQNSNSLEVPEISSAQASDSLKVSAERQLLNEIVAKLKSGASIETVANEYRHLSQATATQSKVIKVVPEAIAVEAQENEKAEAGKIVEVAYQRNRQSRRDSLSRQITKQPKLQTYEVAKGDTLELISKRSGVSQRTLIKLNKIKNPNLLVAGQPIRVPTANRTVTSRSRSNFVATAVKAPKIIAPNLAQKSDNRSMKAASAMPLLQVVAPINIPQAERLVTFDNNVNNNRDNRSAERQGEARPDKSTVKLAKATKNLGVQTSLSTKSLGDSSDSVQNFAQNSPTSFAQNFSVEKVAKVIPSNLTSNISSSPLIEQLPSSGLEPSIPKLPSVLPATTPVTNDLSTENLVSSAKNQSENQTEAKSFADSSSSKGSSKILVATLPKPIDTQVLEQFQLSGKPMELPLVPEAEASISSVEMQQALKSQVKELPTELPTKVAAANIDSLPLLQIDRSNKIVKQNQVSPQLPALSATTYLPEMVSPANLLNAPGSNLKPSNISSSSFIWPAAGVLSSGFGWRWGRAHQGIDIAGPVGTPIVAAAPGVVEFSGWNSGGYGNLVDIRHEDGTVTRYAHNSALYVRAGQAVNQGQAIAAMGSTGFSTGPHLHFEIRPNGRNAVNPINYLARR
jgi:murein DD-endopeptidase MepM/ murein hydrolase activator NlpD